MVSWCCSAHRSPRRGCSIRSCPGSSPASPGTTAPLQTPPGYVCELLSTLANFSETPTASPARTLILAFRLLDADVVRARLTQTVADLVLIVSDAIYQGIVKHGYGRIDPAVFQPVWVTAKETNARAWLHIPGTGCQGMKPAPAPVAATSQSLTDPHQSEAPTLPARLPPPQPIPTTTPLAGRRVSGTWQIPAYAYVQGRVQGPV
jgi:hypothetical protein